HVERHRGAEQRPGVDQSSAIAEVRDIHVHGNDDREKDERNDRAGTNVSAEAAFPERVIYYETEESHGDHEVRAGRPCCVRSQCLVAHVIDHSDKQNSGEPRVGSSPPKPVKRTRHQFGINGLLCRTVNLCLEWAVDPVEKVEMSDPGYSGENV